jgi:hypothetical protein
VLLVPSTERSSIDLDDRVLHKGLSSDQLVVGGVVYDIKDTSLSGNDCTTEFKYIYLCQE